LLNPCLGPIPDGVHTIRWNHQAICHFGNFEMPSHPVAPCMPTPNNRLATISVGAGHPTKAYPSQSWISVAKGLIRQGYEVAFLGGQLDSPIYVDGARDLVGKLPLGQTMDMVARSRVHLCADTGTGHMAAAYGVPVVSIFGPTDPARFRPYTCDGVVLRRGNVTGNVSPGEVLAAVGHLSRSESAVSHP
jgi:ADP-heptose:LPS heptosyltransferase